MPRSVSTSSRSRYDNPNRRYYRTANTITSGEKRNPTNAESGFTDGTERQGDLIISAPSRPMIRAGRIIAVNHPLYPRSEAAKLTEGTNGSVSEMMDLDGVDRPSACRAASRTMSCSAIDTYR